MDTASHPAYAAHNPYAQNPYAQNPLPYLRPELPRRRRTGLIVGIVLGAIVLLAGGSAVGVHSYAKWQVCGAIEELTALSEADAAKDRAASHETSEAQARDEVNDTRTLANMLLFDSELRLAVRGMADDMDRMIVLTQVAKDGDGDAQSMLPELVTVASDFNTRVRDAQHACGLPQKGLFQTA